MYYDLFLDCVKECHDGIPVFAGKIAELFDSVACVALSRYSVPHDGLYRIAARQSWSRSAVAAPVTF